jgi:hypothetical protein
MNNDINIPFYRENAYDLFNKIIKDEFSNKLFYNIITKEKYKIIGIETSLEEDDYFIKIFNIDKKNYEKIKNHELKNLELITKENHP